jgi:hypothetical protein
MQLTRYRLQEWLSSPRAVDDRRTRSAAARRRAAFVADDRAMAFLLVIVGWICERHRGWRGRPEYGGLSSRVNFTGVFLTAKSSGMLKSDAITFTTT